MPESSGYTPLQHHHWPDWRRPQTSFGLSLANDHRPERAWKPVQVNQQNYWLPQGNKPGNQRPIYLLKKPKYLKSKIKDIPGIIPYKLYDNVTRAAYHLFPFRYDKKGFKGLSRGKFLKALDAEGIPCSSGYAKLNKMPFIENTFLTKNFKKMYPKEMLNYEKYMEQNQCPLNDVLCDEEAVWLAQSLLLSPKSEMNDIANAIEKIQHNAEKINKQI